MVRHRAILGRANVTLKNLSDLSRCRDRRRCGSLGRQAVLHRELIGHVCAMICCNCGEAARCGKIRGRIRGNSRDFGQVESGSLQVRRWWQWLKVKLHVNVAGDETWLSRGISVRASIRRPASLMEMCADALDVLEFWSACMEQSAY